MPAWDSPDLLARFNRMADRPPADATPVTEKYQILDEAQGNLMSLIAGVCGSSLFGPPIQMTTSDAGKTWQFGTDGEGNPLFPLGSGSVYRSLDAIPQSPMRNGVDYIDEGVQIRIPNDRAYSGQLFWYGITQPPALSASTQPFIQPPAARILIVIEAVRIWAEDFDRNAALADRMSQRFARELPPWLTQIRKHLQSRYRLPPLVPDLYYPNSAWMRWS